MEFMLIGVFLILRCVSLFMLFVFLHLILQVAFSSCKRRRFSEVLNWKDRLWLLGVLFVAAGSFVFTQLFFALF